MLPEALNPPQALKSRPTVLAVSTSSPRWIDMNGTQTLTSLLRDPQDGPLHFGPDGPEGNEMAVHTERVYAFPIERYDFWAKELGLDREAWPHCFWGENITLTNLNEDDMRVGDLLHFSGGAIMEVTGPRIPCMKMAWRLGIAGGQLRRLTQTGGLGFYMRVIASGDIGSGDTISIERPYPDNITITDLARLHDRGDNADIDRIEAAIATPRIAVQSHEMLLRTLEHMRDMERTRQHRWSGWRDFTVARVRDEGDDVRSVSLEPTDDKPIASFRGGQFLPVRVDDENDTPCIRTWSISDYTDEGRSYRLSVKHVPNGRGSTWIHRLAIGDIVAARPPAGSFVIARSPIRPVVLISAGIGVTPLLSMLRAYAKGHFVLPLTWMHSARSGDNHLFRDEVADLLESNPAFSRQIHYTRPRSEDVINRDFDVAGRIGREHLEKLVSTTSHYRLAGKDIELNGRSREFYICGPRAFEESVRTWLAELRVPDHFIRSENFETSSAAQPDTLGIGSANVVFARSGKKHAWTPSSGTLLDLAESAGLSPDFGCRSGNCGACAARLVDGRIEYIRTPSTETPLENVLLCCARPASSNVIVDL